MPGKILGLDINYDSVAAVQLTSTLKGYQITACAHVSINGDGSPGDVLDALFAGLFAQLNLKSDICHSSVPGEYASYRNLEMPFEGQKKIRQALPFELEPLVPFPIDDLVVDFTLSDQSNHRKILAAALRKTIISDILEPLQAHEIDPDILDIKCVSTVSWLLKQEETPENGLFLQLDGNRNTMVLFLERRIAVVRTFSFNNTSDSTSDSNELNPDDINSKTSGQAGNVFLDFIGAEVQNTIHSFATQNDRTIYPEKVFFSADQSFLPNAEELLNQVLNIPAEQIDLSKNEKIRINENVTHWDPALMNNALALALRETKEDQGFNFRKNEFEKKKHYFGPKKEIRKAAVFFIVLLCFLAADIGLDFHFLNKRYNGLNHQITEIFKKTFPDMKRIVDPEKQMEIELNKIKKSTPLPEKNRKYGVLDLLNDISQRIPDSLEVRLTRVIFDLDTIRLSGNTDTFNTVDKIKSDLESSDFFKAATISSAKLDRKGNKVEFEIKLERTG